MSEEINERTEKMIKIIEIILVILLIFIVSFVLCSIKLSSDNFEDNKKNKKSE